MPMVLATSLPGRAPSACSVLSLTLMRMSLSSFYWQGYWGLERGVTLSGWIRTNQWWVQGRNAILWSLYSRLHWDVFSHLKEQLDAGYCCGALWTWVILQDLEGHAFCRSWARGWLRTRVGEHIRTMQSQPLESQVALHVWHRRRTRLTVLEMHLNLQREHAGLEGEESRRGWSVRPAERGRGRKESKKSRAQWVRLWSQPSEPFCFSDWYFSIIPSHFTDIWNAIFFFFPER